RQPEQYLLAHYRRHVEAVALKDVDLQVFARDLRFRFFTEILRRYIDRLKWNFQLLPNRFQTTCAVDGDRPADGSLDLDTARLLFYLAEGTYAVFELDAGHLAIDLRALKFGIELDRFAV